MSKAAYNNNPADRNTEATVHIGQLDDRVTEDLLWELMVQAGPVKHVYIPRDRITGKHHGYGFCEFRAELDAAYATRILNMVTLCGKPIRLAQSTLDRHPFEIGANLFVGNLAPNVDEKLLYDAFSAFGTILDTPHIMREPDSDASKGYGFVKYTSFDASDAALATMNGQYICNRPIVVQYAYKKDSDGRERHGSQAERLIAQASARSKSSLSLDERFKPHTMFADRPASEIAKQRIPPPQLGVPAQPSLPPMPPPQLAYYQNFQLPPPLPPFLGFPQPQHYVPHHQQFQPHQHSQPSMAPHFGHGQPSPWHIPHPPPPRVQNAAAFAVSASRIPYAQRHRAGAQPQSWESQQSNVGRTANDLMNDTGLNHAGAALTPASGELDGSSRAAGDTAVIAHAKESNLSAKDT